MMQMSHAKVQIRSLSMMVPAHIFKLQCKCLLTKMEMQKCLVVQMPSNGHVMMQMFMWVCRDANVPLWVCRDANVLMVHAMMRMQPCRYAMNANAPSWVYHDTNALMQTQFIQKFLLFSKRGFHNA